MSELSEKVEHLQPSQIQLDQSEVQFEEMDSNTLLSYEMMETRSIGMGVTRNENSEIIIFEQEELRRAKILEVNDHLVHHLTLYIHNEMQFEETDLKVLLKIEKMVIK